MLLTSARFMVSHLLGATPAVRSDSSNAPASAYCLPLYNLWNSRYLPTTYYTIKRKNVNEKSFQRHYAHRAALISVSLALSQRHQLTLPDHKYGTSASRGVPVYVSFRWYSLRLSTEGCPG